MEYNETVLLKNGKEAIIRNGDASDGRDVLSVFNQTHEETDYLLTYADENTFSEEQEVQFLKEKKLNPNTVELVAILDGKLVGSAGIESVGAKYKIRHRAEFGIGVLKEYWGCGVGKALTKACIQCARMAGYTQLELSVVAENDRALAMYRSLGFVEFGRNPRGFRSKRTGYQELVYMLMEL